MGYRNDGPQPHPVTGQPYRPDYGWEPTPSALRRGITHAGRPVGSEDPLAAVAELVGRIDAYGLVENDIEWEPDVAPLRRTIRSAYFPPDHDFEIS